MICSTGRDLVKKNAFSDQTCSCGFENEDLKTPKALRPRKLENFLGLGLAKLRVLGYFILFQIFGVLGS